MNESIANASTSLNSAFGSANELGIPLLLVLYGVGALLAAQFVAPWVAQSQLLTTVGGRLVESIEYAIKGVTAVGVLALLALPFHFVATADADTQGLALTAVGVVIVAYAILVGVGWLADRAVGRFVEAHPEADEFGDLFPEDDTEAVADGGETR